MKLLMQTAALAAALTLAACGGSETQTNETAADNAAMGNGMAMDPAMMNGTMDANATMGANMTMDANGSVDANTANAMATDANTNDPDTNLANGL